MNATANTLKVHRDGTVTLDGTKIGSVGRGWGGSSKAGMWNASLPAGKSWGTYETRTEAVEALVKKHNKELALDAWMAAREVRLAAKRTQKN